MISPTGNQRHPYSFSRQNKASQSGFADLLAKSAAAKTSEAQVQRSAATAGANEDKIEFGSVTGLEANGTTNFIQWKAAEPSFPKSIYDLSAGELEKALHSASDAASHIATEGKSKTEIYYEIQSIYENYLGKDFEEPASLYPGGLRPEIDPHEFNLNLARSKFHESVRINGVDQHDPDVRREIRGYSGMSDDDIRSAVREKYPETMTLRQTLLMSKELATLNVETPTENGDDYASAAINHIFMTMGGWSPAAQKVYDAMLDLPADYDAMKASYDEFVAGDYYYYPTNDMDSVFKKLISWVGGDSSAYGNIMSMLTEMEQKGELGFNSDGYLTATGAF